jgi:hypothetical protein
MNGQTDLTCLLHSMYFLQLSQKYPSQITARKVKLLFAYDFVLYLTYLKLP